MMIVDGEDSDHVPAGWINIRSALKGKTRPTRIALYMFISTTEALSRVC